jgi:bifunctional DNase/RNase
VINMLEMHVGAIALDKENGTPIILLQDAENRRALPIWVGMPEAKAIGLALLDTKADRPSTHDLLLSAVKKLGYKVKEVVINDLDNGVFLAETVLDRVCRLGDNRPITLDARPSDAIALATRCGVPLLVAPGILAQEGVPVDPDRDECETQDFRSFIERIHASDFKLAGPVELPHEDGENSAGR